MFKENIYLVYVDGFFKGVAENDDEIIKIAEESTNGSKPLYDDDWADRVFWETININRYIKDGKNIIDKISNKNILCYNEENCEKAVEELNKINIKKERAEAKIRAINL